MNSRLLQQKWRLGALMISFFIYLFGVFEGVFVSYGFLVLMPFLFLLGLLGALSYKRPLDFLRDSLIAFGVATVIVHLLSYLSAFDGYYRVHQRDFWPDIFLAVAILWAPGAVVGYLIKTLIYFRRRSLKRSS